MRVCVRERERERVCVCVCDLSIDCPCVCQIFASNFTPDSQHKAACHNVALSHRDNRYSDQKLTVEVTRLLFKPLLATRCVANTWTGFMTSSVQKGHRN